MQEDRAYIQKLATLAVLGAASKNQMNELAAITRRQAETCARLACARGKIRYDDQEDVIQNATIKALAYLPRWDAARSSWLTYASRIAATCIADCQRVYEKDARLTEATYEIQALVYDNEHK